MKDKKKISCWRVFYVLISIIGIIALCGLCGTEIYVWATYAKIPIEEIPLWALWFMFRW